MPSTNTFREILINDSFAAAPPMPSRVLMVLGANLLARLYIPKDFDLHNRSFKATSALLSTRLKLIIKL